MTLWKLYEHVIRGPTFVLTYVCRVQNKPAAENDAREIRREN